METTNIELLLTTYSEATASLLLGQPRTHTYGVASGCQTTSKNDRLKYGTDTYRSQVRS